MFKTRLRLILAILGFAWGLFSFFIRLAQEGSAPWEQLISLPATVEYFLFGWIGALLPKPTELPYILNVLLLLFFLLLGAFIGTAIGFVSAVSIEKLKSILRQRHGRKLRLTLASLSALAALAAVLLVVTWAESSGDAGQKNCSLPYPDPEIIYSPDLPRVVDSRPDGFSWNLGVRCWLKLADGSERVIVLKPWWDPSPARASAQWVSAVTLLTVSILSVALIGAATAFVIIERLDSLFHRKKTSSYTWH